MSATDSTKKDYDGTIESFLCRLNKEYKKGVVVTPLVGSGISAPSGVLMGQDFTEFLAYTVCLVLDEGWDIRRNGWPDYPDKGQVAQVKGSIRKKYDRLISKYKESLGLDQGMPEPGSTGIPSYNQRFQDYHLIRPLKPEILTEWKERVEEEYLQRRRETLGVSDLPQDVNLSTSSRAYIEDLAVRSLWHWTKSLEFLSQIAIDPVRNMEGDNPQPALYVTEPESYVIDSFNWHITQGKRPNLIHNMLARLGRSFGNQLILTTNFDTLIEQSFERLREPLHVLAVSIQGGLPAFSTVRSQMSLVKLHGDVLETRADRSINDPPTEVDKERFFNYLRGPGRPYQPRPHDFRASQLLVLGYSANDARCVQMIRGVLDYDPHFRVFWVAHTKESADRIKLLFSDYRIKGEDPQVLITVTDRTDLLLWEIYQRLNLSLPSGGFSFQFTHNIPPEPYVGVDPKILAELQVLVVDKDKPPALPLKMKVGELVNMAKGNLYQHLEILGGSGVARPMRFAFDQIMNSGYECVWLELEDYATPKHALYHFLEIIALRLGRFQLDWVNLIPFDYLDPKASKMKEKPKENQSGDPTEEELKRLECHLRLLVKQLRIDPAKWHLFLYARNGPGGCVGMGLDYWSAQEYGKGLDEVVEALKKLDFKVVHMRFDRTRMIRNHQKALFIDRIVADRIEPDKEKSTLRGMDSQRRWFESLHVQASERSIVPLNAVSVWNILKLKDGDEKEGAGKSTDRRDSYENSIERMIDFIDSIKNKEEREVFLGWLYGSTLFRKSRHSSALISEAVYPCPHRFNSKKRDNDEERAKQVFSDEGEQRGWVGALEEMGILLRKPGGYSWKYRDMRLGIQWILDHYSREAVSETGDELRLSLWSLRPRIHFWIGDWYLRAFYATGHHSPLVEAIYHFVSALELAEHYVPQPRKRDGKRTIDPGRVGRSRQRLAWRAACQLELALDLGMHALRFWCSGLPLEFTFFSGPGKNGSLEEWLSKFSCQSFEKGKVLDLPGYYEEGEPKPTLVKMLVGNGRASKGLVNGVIVEKVRSIQSVVATEGGRHAAVFSQRVSVKKDKSFCLKVEHDTQAIFEGKTWGKVVFQSFYGIQNDPLLEEGHKIPWFSPNWSTECEKEFEGAQMETFASDGRDGILDAWDNSGGSDAQLLAILWKTLEVAYRIVRRAQAGSLEGEVQPTGKEAKQVRGLWARVSVLCHVVLDLSRCLNGESREEGIWLRVRTLSYYGLSLGALGRFFEAHRRLNEAHALLSRGQLQIDPDLLARIHLRRAEVCLYSAMREEKMGDDEDRLEGLSEASTQKYYKIVRDIDGAWSAVEKGEEIMSGSSHSTLWWAKVASLKLHCYALLAEKGVYKAEDDIDRRSSLPFRKRIDLAAFLLDLLRKSFLLGQDDRYRSLRALLHFKKAATLLKSKEKNRQTGSSEDGVNTLLNHLKPGLPDPDWSDGSSVRIHDLWEHAKWACADDVDPESVLRRIIDQVLEAS